MRPRTLLVLYPRAWRARYGDEFLETVGDAPLGVRRTLDVVLGAADAWFAPQLTGAHGIAESGGQAVMTTLKAACQSSSATFTTRDALKGAAATLGVVFAMTGAGVIAGRSGWHATRDVLTSAALPVSLVMSLPFTYSKGHPWKTQAVLVGVPTLILVAASIIAVWI